jgi:hypothetical protein
LMLDLVDVAHGAYCKHDLHQTASISFGDFCGS